jgi:hypothetical protein
LQNILDWSKGHIFFNGFYYPLIAGYSFLLTEYCPRGSLQDILEEREMELDWDFR